MIYPNLGISLLTDADEVSNYLAPCALEFYIKGNYLTADRTVSAFWASSVQC